MVKSVKRISSVTEREVLLDAIYVGRVDGCGAGQPAAAFRIFRLEQMAFAARERIPCAGRNFETFATDFFVLIPLGRRIIQSNFLERARNIRMQDAGSKGISGDLIKERTP